MAGRLRGQERIRAIPARQPIQSALCVKADLYAAKRLCRCNSGGRRKLQQEGYALKHCLIGGALGASAALAVMAAVSMRQCNVAFYWVIVAAYWALRLWEELR